MESTTIHVPSELFACAESSSFDGTYDIGEFCVGPDTYRFKDPLEWEVLVTNTSGALLVMGSVRGEATTECARCLDELPIVIDGEVEGYFIIDGEGEPEEEMDEDEFDHLNDDGTIDLVPLLQAAVIVDLPLLPLCREDCAGICQDCGMNLNEGSCECARKREALDEQDRAAANPFAVLSQLDLGK